MPESAGPQPDKPLRADARRNRARVLDAAESVVAAEGASAAMEEIARRAGVGVGTIYRHFPTKEALLEAIVVGRYERLADDAQSLESTSDAGTAFFTLFRRMVDEAATKKTFADALVGVDFKAATSASGRKLLSAFATLLDRAQRAGAVRRDTDIEGVMAVLTGMCLGAEYGGWDRDRQDRALNMVFDGMRPPGN